MVQVLDQSTEQAHLKDFLQTDLTPQEVHEEQSQIVIREIPHSLDSIVAPSGGHLQEQLSVDLSPLDKLVNPNIKLTNESKEDANAHPQKEHLFEEFYFASGLQLNTSKSQVFTNCSNMEFSQSLEIPQHHLPLLSLPISGPFGKKRNARIFKGKLTAKSQIVQHIKGIIKLIFQTVRLKSTLTPEILQVANSFGVVVQEPTKSYCLVTWIPPPPHWMKANSDGSLTEDRGGYGALLRDNASNLIVGIAGRSSLPSINLLELQGIVAGLSLGVLCGFK
ncbi:hypothetical protein QJS10_CPB11g01218 [Acorus calamus]|uniref:RNase H type-1 domain-containing protein n=1 Tax=Acorus calamus TaxID=4465 RepID=A0AAV9DWP5_ACOCL|nr:hypothetical protein QJS10_CPB11g01218 [Acorus calamus]